MATDNRKLVDALYIIILRDQNAPALLKKWVQENRVTDYKIDNNRITLFNHHHLHTFQMTWKSNWSNVTIWDCWNKRHIYLD